MPGQRSAPRPRHRKKRTARSAGLTARTADRHRLYELAVQSPEVEIDFLNRVYKKRNGRRPLILREDFCGTALTSSTWVRQSPQHRAFGVDLHGPTLRWAREHNLGWLAEEEKGRVTLTQGDVLSTPQKPRADVLAAMNFSYWVFKTRRALLEYFRAAHANLADDGIFVCDCFGGYESQQDVEETRKCPGFTYVWEQADYDPITADLRCHIHFRFPDGTEKRRAFTYNWRLWSIPEVCEMLVEAGFSNPTVYWEGSDEKGGGDGVFRPRKRGEICAGWIAYITAEP